MKSLIMSLALVFSAQAAFGAIYFGAQTASEKKNEFCSYVNTVPQLLADPDSSAVQLQFVKVMNIKWQGDLAQSSLDFVSNTSDVDSCKDYSYSYQQTSGFDIKTALNAKVISLLFWNSSYTGGAHGGYYQVGQTFNSENGQVYSNLGDFIDNSNLQAVKNAIRENIKYSHEGFDFTFGYNEWENSVLDMSSIENFYITSQGITIYFGEYQIASYSEGLIEANLYWYELAPMLKKTGPATLLPTNQ
jgi:hypothetical protein